MAQNDIGIDLGTTTIIIAQEGKGVVLNQPSVVAMDTRKNTVLEAGDKALAMVGRTPNYISAIFPLKDGVISDHTMTRELICRFVKQVYSSHMVKPRVAVCVPAAITGIESDAVVEAVVAAGARQVYLIDEPIAAALGSGIDITLPDGRMIIDIGGGTTDIAVLSLGGKVKATSVRVAGNHYDEEILKHVRNKYSIAIGQRTAEELKKHVACCPQKTDFHESMEIKGRSLLTGLPVRVTVSTDDLYEPVMMLSEQIGTAAHQVLEKDSAGAGRRYLPQRRYADRRRCPAARPDRISEPGTEGGGHRLARPCKLRCTGHGTEPFPSVISWKTGFTDATPRIGRR